MDSQDERCGRISDFQKGPIIRISCQLQTGQPPHCICFPDMSCSEPS